MKPLLDDPHFDERHNVLANCLGITNAANLTEVSYAFTFARLAQLINEPLPGKLNSDHLRAIHRYIFQDVFPWAGDFRTVMTSRTDSFGFPPPIYIAPSLDDLFAKLAQENHLKGIDTALFADRAAFYLGEINAVHAFRDGNGRAQREFIRTLALTAVTVWSGPASPNPKMTKRRDAASLPATTPLSPR